MVYRGEGGKHVAPKGLDRQNKQVQRDTQCEIVKNGLESIKARPLTATVFRHRNGFLTQEQEQFFMTSVTGVSNVTLYNMSFFSVFARQSQGV
jgi:hypothetical protein